METLAVTLAVMLAVTLLVAGCEAGDSRSGNSGVTTLRFWAMGREGEVVQELVRDFEASHPDIRVVVQQIPWSAAHEKLLTAYVGRSMPDMAQLGNTWVPEFTALGALAPLDGWVAACPAVDPADHFSGIWETNVIAGTLYGVPWYVDTRVIYYRTDILRQAGFDQFPRTWAGWRQAMRAVTKQGGSGRYAILLPLNEWSQPVALALETGSTLLKGNGTRGDFRGPEFRQAFDFYAAIFAEGWSPPVSNNEIANLYQEFERGTFAMYISGPWNLGEFRRRLPAELQDAWSTAPLPGMTDARPGTSLAGGSSLVVFRHSENQEAARLLMAFLLEPAQQIRFYELTGDLPAHRAAWNDPRLAADPKAAAFRAQLDHTRATPKIPEWEQIANRVWVAAEEAVRGSKTREEALQDLDQDVDRILTKRRWLLEQEP
ncbi:ABC transporter substrate-binding protein [bacterium DOLZORAL124_64_63]|nr:MAG: ABC transporter substrate-binding protein [bacterium DOLZORAL124_64_63]